MKLEITAQQDWYGRRYSERSLDLLNDNKSAGQFRYKPPTKFEVSTFSRYGDMKCVKLHKMGGGLGWLARLQQIQNSLASAVVKAPKTCHITPILRSLH